MANFTLYGSLGWRVTAPPRSPRTLASAPVVSSARSRAGPAIICPQRRCPLPAHIPISASGHGAFCRSSVATFASSSSGASDGEGGVLGAEEVPTVMVAARYADYGSPREVLSLASDVPVPGAKEGLPEDTVLIRVEAAALNASDHKCMAGFYKNTQKRELPVTPGAEVSGTVVAAGPGAGGQWIGRDVWADVTGLDGAFAQFCACPLSSLAAKPANLSHVEAVTLPVAGSTSLQALRQVGLSGGESVLVLGGSTGCGVAGIQIAKALGASTVCTTASEPSHAVLRELGADEAVDYRALDWRVTLQGRKFDVVYDCVGGRSSWVAAKTRGVLADKGRYISIVGDTESRVGEPITPARSLSTILRLLARTVRGAVTGQRYSILFKQPSSECLDTLRGWAEEGKLRPLVESEFGPLVEEEAGGECGAGAEAGLVEMFERSMGRVEGRVEGSLAGKLVLRIRS